MNVKIIDWDLNKISRAPNVRKMLTILRNDKEIGACLEQANKVSIVRLGYNDHGEVHAKIVALNALRMFGILEKKGVKGSIITEEIGNSEDARMVLLVGAYLHDIGCSIAREGHELIGMILARPIVKRILKNFYNEEKLNRISCFVLETILCHMGNYKATSLEAKIVGTADGTDLTKGRARIPFHIGKASIHKFSALAIEKVKISPGIKKPLAIEILMDNPAGVFQAEATLVKKIKDANFENFVEVVAKIKGEEEVKYL